MVDGITYSDLGYGLDIAPSTISLREGWRGLEVDESGQFRRIAGHAQALFASAGLVCEVTIDVAPVPHETSSLTFEARVDGIVYHANRIQGRTRIRFLLPPGEAAIRRVSLQVTGGTARVYRLAALLHARDVVPTWLGMRVGRGGWYPLEGFDPNTFRYVNREAEIVIGRPAKSLDLDVEPGPGVAYQPFDLDVFNGDGALLRRVRIEGRTRMTLELPDLRSLPGRLVLRCDGGGRPAPPDARLMDFRLFPVPAPWERSELLRRLAARGPITGHAAADALQPAENAATK